VRLILTQSTYLVQKCLDAAGPTAQIIFTADRNRLLEVAPEVATKRGPWRHFALVDLDRTPEQRDEDMDEFPSEVDERSRTAISDAEQLLIQAYQSETPEDRVMLCHQATELEPKSGTAALALASAYRETGDQLGWRKALDHAHKIFPKWEAAYYEDGKFWLACEDMARARAAFERACEMMPTFSAAWSNLGATLGELDYPEDALKAFKEALASDPDNVTILNNVGVVTRELGRLAESEENLKKVTSIAPEFVFGHYNLGHTRFLKGDYRGALEAYEEGQNRDPQKNRRQGCRLALVRLANEDLEGAEHDLWAFADEAPPEERAELLLEAYEIARTLVGDEPALAPHRAFLQRIATEITR
jgi:tetratricopeptide (TPR) repeat protein